MHALLLSSLCCAYQAVAGWLLPGMFIHWYVLHRIGGRKSGHVPVTPVIHESRSQYLFQCLGIGSIFLSCQFLVQYLLFWLDSSTAAVAIVTVVAHGFFSGLWWGDYRRAFVERSAWWSPGNWDVAGRIQCVAALLFGFLAVLYFPHGLDNTAIGWVTHSVNKLQPLQDSQGAPSYIGLLFLPGFLMDGMAPVPTIAAGFKILLSLLLAAASRRLVEVVMACTSISERHRGWYALMLQLMVWATFFGKYGVFETGKETPFAILLLFVFAAELIAAEGAPAEGASRRWYWLAALPLASAVGFGAMAVPYGFILTATFLLFSVGRIRPFRFGFCCLALSWLPLVFSFHAMADWSWSRSLALLTLPLLLFGFADRVFGRIVAERVPILPNWIPWLVLTISLAVIAFLLPIKFHRGYFPLDGTTGLIQLVFHQNKFVLPGLFGMMVVMASPRMRGNAGMLTLMAFPSLALVPALVIARWYTELEIPIHPQNVWDWAKDIPNWVSGIYFGLFAVLAFGFLGQRSKGMRYPLRYPVPATIGLLLLVVMGVTAKQYVKLVKARGFPTYTAIGGHHDRLLAEFLEWAYLYKTGFPIDRLAGNPVLLANESKLNHHAHSLWLFGVDTISENETSRRGPLHRNTYWCVSPENQLVRFLDGLDIATRFRAQRENQVDAEFVYRIEKIRQTRERFSAIPSKMN